MTEAPMSVLLAEPPNTTDFPLVSVLDSHMIGQKRQMEDGNGAFFWGEDGRDSKKRGKRKFCNDIFFQPIIANIKRTATGNEPPPGYVCKRCNVPGHFVRDCPQAKNASGSLPEGYVCRICNEPGHHIKECPQAGQNKEATKRTGPPEGYVCRICSEPGHWIQDCPIKEQQDRERDSNRQEIANRGSKYNEVCEVNYV
jgi:hypothetical protein